jgi:uncharacterized cupin superfamily protein
MQPIRLPSPETLPSDALADWGPAKEPVGNVIAQIRGSELGKRDRVGVWECTPGRWRRQVMEREFAHFVSGAGRFLPDYGEPFDIRAGDAVWFPADTTGTWEITETLRKSYVIVGFGPLERILRVLSRRLGALRRMISAQPGISPSHRA